VTTGSRGAGRIGLVLAGALVVLTLAVYAPVFGFEFLNYDDPSYVVDEPHVNTGLTLDNVRWSLTAYANANWHPLTMMSHMLDVTLFGVDAAAHHGVNLALHAVNVVLLFWLLAVATSRPWPSAFVAALFAVHPLNVQTVAWIAERKSLLSTAFWLLALLAHVRLRQSGRRSAWVWGIVFAGLALASKPMAVTLPLTLVLLDFWPLAAEPAGKGSKTTRYVRDLWPYLALALVCGLLTLAAQRAGQAIQPLTAISLPDRLGNGVVAYAWYLKTMLWPHGLAVFYPHPVGTITASAVAVSAVVLVAISALVIASRRMSPALAMGWCWYIGTLLPVAGFIQVGSQAYADRYAYVPLIGIFIAIAWSVVTLLPQGMTRPFAAIAAAASITGFALATRHELPYWHDTIALFTHATEVVPNNSLAENNLGMALVARKDMAGALPHFARAVDAAPWDSDARANLGNALRALGRPAEAIDAYAKALEVSPEDASTHFNLATALIDVGRADEAVGHLREAVRLNPEYLKARFLLAESLYRQGHADAALVELREIVRIDPQNQRAAELVRRIGAQVGG
jgi:Flp pilus assembly protein TadD